MEEMKMTEIINEPIKKIIIKNLVHETFDNLIAQCHHRKQTVVSWVDGMIISIPKLIYANGEIEYKNMMEGIQYFEKIVFVKFPMHVTNIAPSNCPEPIHLLNYSNNTKFKELAKWIKSQPIWNETLEDQK
jgi:hypothetical protein